MLIQIRGTSGSGKSTAMCRFMTLWADKYGAFDPVHVEGRKQPLYYEWGGEPMEGNPYSLIVLGHYSTQCGGCDTIGSAKAVWELIHRLRKEKPGCFIACEGLLLSEDSKWVLDAENLREEIVVLYLTTDVEKCIRQIKSRRAKAGNDKPLKEDNTRNRVAVIERSRVKLKQGGVSCRRVSSNQAPTTMLRIFENAGRSHLAE